MIINPKILYASKSIVFIDKLNLSVANLVNHFLFVKSEQLNRIE